MAVRLAPIVTDGMEEHPIKTAFPNDVTASGMTISEARETQPENALLPKLRRLSGKDSDVSESQFSNAWFPIFCTRSPNVTDLSETQPLHRLSPTVTTPSGIVIANNDVQPLKVSSFKTVNSLPEPIETAVSEVHPWKEYPPRVLTVSGSTRFVNFVHP